MQLNYRITPAAYKFQLLLEQQISSTTTHKKLSLSSYGIEKNFDPLAVTVLSLSSLGISNKVFFYSSLSFFSSFPFPFPSPSLSFSFPFPSSLSALGISNKVFFYSSLSFFSSSPSPFLLLPFPFPSLSLPPFLPLVSPIRCFTLPFLLSSPPCPSFSPFPYFPALILLKGERFLLSATLSPIKLNPFIYSHQFFIISLFLVCTLRNSHSDLSIFYLSPPLPLLPPPNRCSILSIGLKYSKI